MACLPQSYHRPLRSFSRNESRPDGREQLRRWTAVLSSLLATSACVSVARDTPLDLLHRNWNRATVLVVDEMPFFTLSLATHYDVPGSQQLKGTLIVAWIRKRIRGSVPLYPMPDAYGNPVNTDAYGNPFNVEELAEAIVVHGNGADGITGSDDDEVGVVSQSRSEVDRLRSGRSRARS